MKLKITTVGNSAGIVLPKEILTRLRLDKGDMLYATEIPGGIQLMPYDPKFEEQMSIADSVMKRRRTLLHKLSEN